MFQIDDVILSDDIATVKFACDVSRCKGACCVVGDAGAPVEKSEIPVLRKAYQALKSELRHDAIEEVEKNGLVKTSKDGTYELACTHNEACVFVIYDEKETAVCAIQKAYKENRFYWEKPISCHLFPIRLNQIGTTDFANYQYIPSMCSSACDRGKREGIYLSDFLKEPLIRKYGSEWYQAFLQVVEMIRNPKK